LIFPYSKLGIKNMQQGIICDFNFFYLCLIKHNFCIFVK
jgi:hypothetical protein